MGEVELGRVKTRGEDIPSDNLVDGNAHERMVLRWTPIIEVFGPACRNGSHQR
jgi:hypothetical protein